MPDHAKHLDALFRAAYRVHDNTRSADPNIHVSNLINFCARAYWLCRKHDRSYHGYEHPGLSRGWTFDMGHALQRIQVQRLMTQQVVFAAWECRHCKHLEVGLQQKGRPCPKCKCKSWKAKDLGVEVCIPLGTKKQGQLIVRGNIDYVVATSPMAGYVVDAKSLKAEDFDVIKEPHIDYKRQLRLYMWMLNHPHRRIVGTPRDALQIKDFKFDGRQAVCCYCVKGARKEPFKPFAVEQDAGFIAATENKLQLLAKHIVEDTEPDRPCKSQANLMAKQCPARTLCFPGKGR